MGCTLPVDQGGSLDAVNDVGTPVRKPRGVVIAGLSVLEVLTLWLGFRDYQARKAQDQHAAMIEAGRQGVLNLTTIDHEQVQDDVQRILDSSTGAFRDDFEKRAQPFMEAARKAQSTSVGTVSDAGLEVATGATGQVPVALTVMTSNRGVPERQPKNWRTRVTVTKVDGEFKVAAVEFIP